MNRRQDQARRFWQSVARLTSLGWSMALPIALGILLGKWLDSRLESGTFWTLALLSAGLGIAVIEAFRTIQNAIRRQERN